MSELEHLRPHARTGDEAPVSYRAKHIRALFAEIERLQRQLGEIVELEAELDDPCGEQSDTLFAEALRIARGALEG